MAVSMRPSGHVVEAPVPGLRREAMSKRVAKRDKPLAPPCHACTAEPTYGVAHMTHPAFCGGTITKDGIRHDGYRHRLGCSVYAALRERTAP